MFCPKCGHLLQVDDAFCGNCGEEIAKTRPPENTLKRKRAAVVVFVAVVVLAVVVGIAAIKVFEGSNSAWSISRMEAYSGDSLGYSVDYSYDDAGNRVSTKQTSYDGSEVAEAQSLCSITYDSEGAPVSSVYKDESGSYHLSAVSGLDDEGRLTSVSFSLDESDNPRVDSGFEASVLYKYNDAGSIVESMQENDLDGSASVAMRQFDEQGYCTVFKHDEDVFYIDYKFDPLGKPTGMEITTSSLGTIPVNVECDEHGNIAHVYTEDDSELQLNYRFEYEKIRPSTNAKALSELDRTVESMFGFSFLP